MMLSRSLRENPEQLLEIVAVAVDGGAELGLGLILAADLVERLLALQRVEPAVKTSRSPRR